MRYLIFPLICIFILFAIGDSNAQQVNQIISNSEDWHDVYSTSIYSNLLGIGNKFLVSERHGQSLLNSFPKTYNIQIVSSNILPFFIGYKEYMESQGYPEPIEITSDNINLELANDLNQIRNFIILDDSYGYDAVSVAPYSIIKKSYPLFANKRNIDDIQDFLSSKEIDELIIYGNLDNEVSEALSIYNPIIIDEGDRFQNNIEIVKRYRDIKPAKQIILSNGEFLEREIMSGVEPVLFIGRNNVPVQIKDYIQSTDIEVGVLIGNELINTAANVRREVGINTFVKFAQGARSLDGPISNVEGLDLFYLPVYTLQLAIEGIKYNLATNQIELTYNNPGDLGVYIRGIITLTNSDGDLQRVGEINPVFIDKNSLRTTIYGGINVSSKDLSADIFTIYGESQKSLDSSLEVTLPVDIIEVLDNCEIDINKVTYHISKESFIINAINTGEVNCYVDVELVDLAFEGDDIIATMTDVEQIEPKKSKGLPIEIELSDDDQDENEIVQVRALYGERRNSLTKTIEGEFELFLKKFDLLFYIAILIIILLIIGLVILKRKKPTISKEGV
jgi:hypothetical protein